MTRNFLIKFHDKEENYERFKIYHQKIKDKKSLSRRMINETVSHDILVQDSIT